MWTNYTRTKKADAMTTLPLTSLITLLAVALMFWTSLNVGKARAKYEVKAPATSGHEMFAQS